MSLGSTMVIPVITGPIGSMDRKARLSFFDRIFIRLGWWSMVRLVYRVAVKNATFEVALKDAHPDLKDAVSAFFKTGVIDAEKLFVKP